MQSQQKTRVKICCIANVEEAQLAIQYGASAIGLVSAMPSGPGPISEEQITKIVSLIPSTIETFLLTSKQAAKEIIEQQRRTKTSTLQIVDSLPFEHYEILRKELPSIHIVQVIHVRDEQSITEAVRSVPYADALLLDSGNPSLAVKELGGTGRVHDWNISRKIRESVQIPVYLAGGLTAENVRQAITHVQPFGVDVCSGVRTNGKLDEHKLANFFAAVSHASMEIN